MKVVSSSPKFNKVPGREGVADGFNAELSLGTVKGEPRLGVDAQTLTVVVNLYRKGSLEPEACSINPM